MKPQEVRAMTPDQLSEQQIQDVAAYVSQSTES